jgi:LacI family transcriptional regulator
MATTIKDVARLAGVSVATVSRALNGHANVTPRTREHVMGMVAQLRFVPSSAARSMITRRTHTVGALLPDLHGEYFSELIRGIDLAARARGLHLLVSSSHGDAVEAAAALRAMAGRVDGLLVMSPHANADFLWGNVADDLPAVLMNTQAIGAARSSFVVDNYGGAHAMVRHFVEGGHRRIAFIAGPESNFEAQERLRGYRAAIAELLVDECELVLQGDFTQESGFRAGGHVVALTDRPSAVFAGNDVMAIGCLSALNEAGLRVPRDFALAGFDDIPISRYVNPPLTTVRARIAELGGLALERLASAIEEPGRTTVQHQTLRADLVVRQSTTTPPMQPSFLRPQPHAA